MGKKGKKSVDRKEMTGSAPKFDLIKYKNVIRN